MITASAVALRDGLPSLSWLSSFLLCALVVAVVLSGLLVTIFEGLGRSEEGRRAARAFDKIDVEWRQFVRAVRRARMLELLRRIKNGVTRWFDWKNQTKLGRLDNLVVWLLASAWLCLFGVIALFRVFV